MHKINTTHFVWEIYARDASSVSMSISFMVEPHTAKRVRPSPWPGFGNSTKTTDFVERVPSYKIKQNAVISFYGDFRN